MTSDPWARQRDGFRYVRQYRTKDSRPWALWERQNGRMRRVGTARTEENYRAFLRGDSLTVSRA